MIRIRLELSMVAAGKTLSTRNGTTVRLFRLNIAAKRPFNWRGNVVPPNYPFILYPIIMSTSRACTRCITKKRKVIPRVPRNNADCSAITFTRRAGRAAKLKNDAITRQHSNGGESGRLVYADGVVGQFRDWPKRR